MKNNSFEELIQVLETSQRILIYPHVSMDGDTLGSSAALCAAMRKLGKECYILIEDSIPANLAFLDRGYCSVDQDIISRPDLSVCVDCGDASRFEKRRRKFESAPVTVCIDHHRTTRHYCTYNYVDPAAAATGELIYRLLQQMGVPFDAEMGEAIFAAITTDTGNFQYANTTGESHRIAAELYELGADFNRTSIALYENTRIEKVLIENEALSTMSLISGGRGIIAYVTQDMLKKTGASMDETESVVQKLRSIGTVEAAVFLKETETGTVKVSMRSKTCVDVAEIAAELHGGGHARAAGCTLSCSLSEAFDLMREKLAEKL